MMEFTQGELDSIETALERAARLEKALVIIAAGWEPRSGAPKMCGATYQDVQLRKQQKQLNRMEGKINSIQANQW